MLMWIKALRLQSRNCELTVFRESRYNFTDLQRG